MSGSSGKIPFKSTNHMHADYMYMREGRKFCDKFKITKLKMNPPNRREELRSLIRGHEVEEDREVGDGEVKVPLEDGAVCLERGVLVILIEALH